MARTKRTIRTARAPRKTVARPVKALQALRANATATLGTLMQRGEALRKEGRKLAIATTRDARKAVMNRADEARSAAVGAVTSFERVFQDRVTRVVSSLGIPTARDVRALSRQVAVLQQSVDQLRRVRARA
jgi:poly(hydroxyalkanoate) granule-associated protein